MVSAPFVDEVIQQWIDERSLARQSGDASSHRSPSTRALVLDARSVA
jgi:hypothetical protein